MHLSNENLLVILVVGLVAGWLAGKFVRGAGFGLIGDLVIGIVGAFIGDWLLPEIGIHLGTGIVSAIVNATIRATRGAEIDAACGQLAASPRPTSEQRPDPVQLLPGARAR